MRNRINISRPAEWFVVGFIILAFAAFCFCCGYKAKIEHETSGARDPGMAERR
jgi:hypothetical protein